MVKKIRTTSTKRIIIRSIFSRVTNMDPSRHGGGKKHTLVASGVRLCFHAFVADLLLYSIRDSTAGYRQRHNSQVTWTPTSAKRPRRARKLQATERDPARLSLRYPAQSTDHPPAPARHGPRERDWDWPPMRTRTAHRLTLGRLAAWARAGMCRALALRFLRFRPGRISGSVSPTASHARSPSRPECRCYLHSPSIPPKMMSPRSVPNK